MPVWEARHGARDNTGYARINTAPIRRTPLTIPNLGRFADGVAPVTASNGQVFICNDGGRLYAFEANGTPLWHRDLGHGFVATTSPVVGTPVQGHFTIYVLGTRAMDDHTVSPVVTRAQARLFAFTETGTPRWEQDLPFDDVREFRPAPPSLLQRFVAPEWLDSVILTLAFVSNPYPGLHTRIIAVSSGGAIEAVKDVSSYVSPIEGDVWWVPGFSFPLDTHPVWDTPVVLPAPGAAVEASGWTPRIWVTDGIKYLFHYDFDGHAFTEQKRIELPGQSSPVMLDPHENIAEFQRIAFYSAGSELRSSNVSTGPLGGTRVIAEGQATKLCPTYLGNHVLMFTRSSDDTRFPSGLVVVANGAVVSETTLPSQTMVPAAASQNHIFVSTKNVFLQYDRYMQKVGEVPWVNGGRIGPAIGPDGWVYAMASNILFIFPPMQNTGPVGGAHDTTHAPLGGGAGNAGRGRLG